MIFKKKQADDLWDSPLQWFAYVRGAFNLSNRHAAAIAMMHPDFNPNQDKKKAARLLDTSVEAVERDLDEAADLIYRW